MQIIDLLEADRIVIDAKARSKKRVLELAGEMLAKQATGLTQRDVFSSLCARERLGTTALGHGVAIPHGRLEQTSAAAGALIRLRDAIDFEAPDGRAVDLVFALIVPEHCETTHLKLLAQLAELFSQSEQRQRLRQADSCQSIFDELERWQSRRVA